MKLAVATQSTTSMENPTVVDVPPMSPSGLPSNSCYHPDYPQSYHPTVVTTHTTMWVTTQHLVPPRLPPIHPGGPPNSYYHPCYHLSHDPTFVTPQQTFLAEHDKWRVGNVEPLQAQEESPFIGQLDPGKHQLAIETGMYRAPGFAYTTPPTDFLLIRNATGAMSLRELTGCFAVGQQVPAMRAPVPGSRDVR